MTVFPTVESPAIRKYAVQVDAQCVAVITCLSALPYLRHLGFYSDDWSLLAGFSAEGHGTFANLIDGDVRGRPVQAVYLAALFRLFGLNPLGYHLVNTAVLAGSAAALYALLRRLRFARSVSFATTLVFVMLPQLSTVRVWYSAFQVGLSLALMLVSIHCQLSFVESGKKSWLAAAVAAGLLSVGAYEIFAPLLAGFSIALIFASRRSLRPTIAAHRARAIAAGSALVALVVLGFLYKLAFSGRAGPVGDPRRYLQGLHQLFRLDYDWRADSGLNIIATSRAHFWAPVQGWWKGAEAFFSGQADLLVTSLAILIAAIALWRLEDCKRQADRSAPRLFLLGIVTFLLGNATFLIVPAVAFTSTGMDNRVQVAAALGVAMILVALVEFALKAVAAQRRAMVFSLTIAIISVAAFVRLSAIERYWGEAPALEGKILAAARADLGKLPANSTVILDGICPYHGPAVVLETYWDTGGALSLALDRPIQADTTSDRLSLTPSGLETSIYKEPRFYAYAPNLYVYNPVKHQLVRLDNAVAANRYFHNRDLTACPGFVARGVEV